MSLDAMTECTECKKHSALRIWIQVFTALDLARLYGSGPPDFLSAFLPSPGLLKVEVCVACRTFRPLLEYTKEEEEAMRRHAADEKRKAEAAENLEKLMGRKL